MQCFPLAASWARRGKAQRRDKMSGRESALSVGSCDTLQSFGNTGRMRGDSWANADMDALHELRERMLHDNESHKPDALVESPIPRIGAQDGEDDRETARL